MKYRGLLKFRLAIAITIGISCLLAALNFYRVQPAGHLKAAVAALFGIAWIAQAYYLRRDLIAPKSN
jgi:hypothetical protein